MREEAGKLIATWRRDGCELGFGAGIAQGYATLGQIGFSEQAILTARSAGSGIGTGSLKNTMIPSPENWSSVPSNWLTSGPKAPWYSRKKSRTSSGSAVSVNAV